MVCSGLFTSTGSGQAGSTALVLALLCVLVALSASMWVLSCLLLLSTHRGGADDVGPRASTFGFGLLRYEGLGLYLGFGWFERLSRIDIASKKADQSRPGRTKI